MTAAQHIPTLITENELQSMTKPLTQKLGLSFFNFARMYDNGSCLLMSTNHKVMDYIFNKEYPLYAPIPKDLLKKKFLYLIPTNSQYDHVMHEVHQYFNLGSALDFFEVNKGYVDVCCFGSEANNNTMINSYLNNINEIESFFNEFKNKISSNLKNKNNLEARLILSEKTRLNFSSEAVILSSASTENDVMTILSEREKVCLDLYIRGKSAREIANILNRSNRTVEHTLESIKNKLNVSKKSELIEKVIDYYYKSEFYSQNEGEFKI